MTIPASAIVNVNPGVLGAGGNPLALNGLFLTQNTQMPTGSVYGFTSQLAVANFFGPASAEAAIATIYFGGYTNATQAPNAMLFAPYNLAARAAWLQSGSLASMTLAQLQALTAGTITITVNGVAETSSSINLTSAASFSAAAALIAAAFTGDNVTVAWNAVNSTFVITSTTTGAASTITFGSGALATGLNLTSATGAILSQGAVLDTPTSAMNNAVAVSQNWATFQCLGFEPTLANKELFAQWSNAQKYQYLYLAGDTDGQAIVQGSTEPFGVVAKAAAYNGVMCISGDPAAAALQGTTLAVLVPNVTAFVAGAIASINFSQANGRRNLAFMSQSGLGYTCANQQTAANLLANGYSFYGSYATANQGFVFLYNGNIPGQFVSATRFINQIWMNSQFQLALMELATQVPSIGYDTEFYELIRAALMGPITAALSFGAIRAGVTLSTAQIAEVNLAAGVNAAGPIGSLGYYLQILDPGATARANGSTPIINCWSTDGGDILLLSLASIDVL